MQQYQVGQILFLIADASKVVPIQVVEEVIRTTLDGKEKTYIVKFPDKKSTTADIKKVKGTLFKSKSEVKAYMLENAKSAIEQMLAIAEEMSINIFNDHPDNELIQEHFQKDDDILEHKVEQIVQPEVEDNIIRVDLGNGKFGKINSKDFNKAGAPE
jgi:hypothetical protein